MVEAIRLRDDDVHEEPAVSLDSFLDQSNATAVRIEAGEDARQLLPFLDRLSLIEIDFTVFGDGRGYSSAQILRESGYTGELRASGDVLVHQIAYLRRCGFDCFAPIHRSTQVDGTGSSRMHQSIRRIGQRHRS